MPDVAYGDGTISPTKDGRLAVRVSFAGKRRTVMIPANPDKREQRRQAEAERKRLVDQREAGVNPSGQTVAVYLRSWLESIADAKRSRIRVRTLEHYRLIVERHIIPALGRHKLAKLSERHIQAWLDADPAAPRTVHHHRAVLRRALNVAVRQRLIARNPALAVELPVVERFEASPLTLPEARALLAATAGDRLGAFWRLALDTGLREGELLALGRDDIELEAGTVTVSSQLQRRFGAWIRSQTKAARTLTRIAIGPGTVAALRAHLVRQAGERKPDWRYHGLLFVTPHGEPYHSRQLIREFHAACDRAGIPRRRVHDLRGSAATLLMEVGVEEAVRMGRLGHATVDMARHYGKVREAVDRDAAARLDAALG